MMMMETSRQPINITRRTQKSFLKVGKIVGVAKYSFKLRTNAIVIFFNIRHDKRSQKSRPSSETNMTLWKQEAQDINEPLHI